MSKEVDVLLMCSCPPRFWPEAVRQRVNSTYTYFASGLGVTSVAAFAATRAASVMRFMAGRPVAVSITTLYQATPLQYNRCYSMLLFGVHKITGACDQIWSQAPVINKLGNIQACSDQVALGY